MIMAPVQTGSCVCVPTLANSSLSVLITDVLHAAIKGYYMVFLLTTIVTTWWENGACARKKNRSLKLMGIVRYVVM